MFRVILRVPWRGRLAAGLTATLLALWLALPLPAQTPIDEPTFQTPPGQGVVVEAPTPKRVATPAPPAGSQTALAAEKRGPESASKPFNRNPGRHQQFLARAKLGKLDLLFLGDSILDFMPRAGEWTWLRLAPDNPADFGVGGERTDDLLWRVENGELDGIHPKVVVLLIGTNNFGTHKAEQPEWVAAGVKKIVDTIHEKLPATRVLLLGIFPRGAPDDPLRPKIAAANAMLAKFDDGKTTRYLDVGNKFLDGQGNLPHDVMADQLHPTAKGYEIWWEAMHPLLDGMMAMPTPKPGPGPSATPASKSTPATSPASSAKPK